MQDDDKLPDFTSSSEVKEVLDPKVHPVRRNAARLTREQTGKYSTGLKIQDISIGDKCCCHNAHLFAKWF